MTFYRCRSTYYTIIIQMFSSAIKSILILKLIRYIENENFVGYNCSYVHEQLKAKRFVIYQYFNINRVVNFTKIQNCLIR